MKQIYTIISILPILLFQLNCNSVVVPKVVFPNAGQIIIEAESFASMEGEFIINDLDAGGKAVLSPTTGGWLSFELAIPVSGRYKCEITLSAENDGGSVWVEDYYDNTDGRTYNITSSMPVRSTGSTLNFTSLAKDGSPLNAGPHKLKLHVQDSKVNVDRITFTLLKEHQITPKTMTQNTSGEDWRLVWSDEFDGSGLPDSSKWTYDIGNWGWGNNEPQYYTEFRTENARQENGNLIIEARRNDMGQQWTSARLTTRGKVGFIYGKIEFRAMPPAGVGTWAAGWLLGDAYRDEISWPYCGEVDILECVGSEVNQATGDGINHASCHTRAFYFKQGNHLTSTIPVKNMIGEFHTYSIEWTDQGINAFMDGEKYYTYDKLNGDWEWPFNQAQNIILNLAMGGGMGGNIDPALESQKLIVDYARVYERR